MILHIYTKFNMASRTTKIIGFSVPAEIARGVEELARKERKTKSELFRQMVSIYRRYARLSEALELAAIETLIREANRGSKRSAEAEVKEFRRLQRYGQQAAKKLGIKTDADVNRLVEEFRAGR